MLNKFTIGDRQDLVRLLKLGTENLENYSPLYNALVTIETRDDSLGTNIADAIQANLTELRNLELAIAEAQTDPSYGANSYREQVDGYYEFDVNFNRNQTIDSGMIARSNDLINEIKRYLNLPVCNRIPLG